MNKSSRASSQVRTAPCGGNVEVLPFGVCGREKCARVPQITQKCVIRWMSLQKRPAWYQRTSPLFPAPNLQPSHQKPWLPPTFSLHSPLPDPAISNPSLLRGFVSPITAPSAHHLCARHPPNYSGRPGRSVPTPRGVWSDQGSASRSSLLGQALVQTPAGIIHSHP